MPEKLKYPGDCCSSGVLLSFTGANLSLDKTYQILFETIDTIPTTTNVKLNPTGYFLTPSETSPTLQTLFISNSNISDNSSVNLISLSVFDDNQQLVYKDYKTLSCQDMCGSGVPISPTPTPTPTITPSNTPTPTPTPAPPPLFVIRAAYDNLINKVPSCDNVLVKAKAYGAINQTYSYSFTTDMSGVDLKISNPSGYITIYENPTYVYTTITLPESCKNYSLEFGLSDGIDTVQSVAVFTCGNC